MDTMSNSRYRLSNRWSFKLLTNKRLESPKALFLIYFMNSLDYIKMASFKFYHYSLQKFDELVTRRVQGNLSEETVRLSEVKAKKLKDIGAYVDHISLFLDPIPLDKLPDLFDNQHPFYKKNVKIFEHVVELSVNDKMKWALVETPEIHTFSDGWDWDNLDKATRVKYIRRINEEMYNLKLQGDNISQMFSAIKPYVGKTTEYFIKARESKWANDTKLQYAAEVPHLMVYPEKGRLKVSSVVSRVMGK